MKDIKDSEILEVALQTIADPQLWCKQSYRRALEGGAVAHCGEGAIHYAFNKLMGRDVTSYFRDSIRTRVMDRVIAELHELYHGRTVFIPGEKPGRKVVSIAYYNDAPDMDHHTMCAAFTKARNKALEEGR